MLISTKNWDNVLGNNNANVAYETFNNKINQLISFSSYIVTGSTKNHIQKMLKEWLAQGLIVSIRNKNILSSKLLK